MGGEGDSASAQHHWHDGISEREPVRFPQPVSEYVCCKMRQIRCAACLLIQLSLLLPVQSTRKYIGL